MTNTEEQGRCEGEMPRYVSHKKVHALEIKAVGESNHGYRSLAFQDDGYQGMSVPEEMFSRYSPVAGDYLVVYADGYKSFSPRKAFLEGYTRDTGARA